MAIVPVIGLEIHARLKTKTKLWCRCANEAIPESPNKNICPICTGFPGMLPLLNNEAVELAKKAATALNLHINTLTKFDRKNYFYPDLPMGYQISQFDQPLAEDGYLHIAGENDEPRKVAIERLHMENDAGKLSHYAHGSFVDYNRSGAPLMEIVSKPDMFSSDEASKYAREMQQILRTVGASDCDMEKGQMRFDINISVHEEGTELGTKVEIKNVNSFKSMEKAIAFEIGRQKECLQSGEKILQETRGWDDGLEKTVSQRTKEGAADYRYFPEPDIPPMSLDAKDILELKNHIPELPFEKRQRYIKTYGFDKDTARILCDDRDLTIYFEEVSALTEDPKLSANYITTSLLALMNEDKKDITSSPISARVLASLLLYVKEDKISHLSAKEVLNKLYFEGGDVATIIQDNGYIQISDMTSLEKIIDEVIAENPNQTNEYRTGKVALFGFFLGQVMKKSSGSANPKIVGEILKSRL